MKQKKILKYIMRRRDCVIVSFCIQLTVMLLCPFIANASYHESFNDFGESKDLNLVSDPNRVVTYDRYVEISFYDENNNYARDPEYYELIKEPETDVYVGEADLPAGRIFLNFKKFRIGRNETSTAIPGGNLYRDEPLRQKLEAMGGKIYNWQGGHLRIKVSAEERADDGETDYWVELSCPTQPKRPELGFSETAYIIGDFNDWQMPEGDDLKGAFPIKRTDNLDDLHVAPWYNAYLDFPAGQNRFTVYVPPTDSFAGGFAVPASGELTDISTSIAQSDDPKWDGNYYKLSYPYDYYLEPDVRRKYALQESFDRERSFRMEKWDGGELRFQLLTSDIRIIPRRYTFFEPVWRISYEFNGRSYYTTLYHEWYGVGDYPEYYLGGPKEYEFPIEGYVRTDDPVDYFGTDIMGVTGQSEFELGPEEQKVYISMSFGSSKPFRLNWSGKRKIRLDFNMNRRRMAFYVEADEMGLTDVSADPNLRLEGLKAIVSTPCEIRVYSTSGASLGVRTGTEFDLSPFGPGIYLIHAAGKTLKVAL